MKAFYYIREKGKISLLLLIVILVVLFFNYSYHRNLKNLGSIFREVYYDRLIAQDYIYKMSAAIYDQHFHLNSENTSVPDDFLSKSNNEISRLLLEFEKTKLTETEKTIFYELKKKTSELKSLTEAAWSTSDSSVLYENKITDVLRVLSKLSDIQLSRGTYLNDTSESIALDTEQINVLTFVALIVIGILVQVIVFNSKSTQPRFPQDKNLN